MSKVMEVLRPYQEQITRYQERIAELEAELARVRASLAKVTESNGDTVNAMGCPAHGGSAVMTPRLPWADVKQICSSCALRILPGATRRYCAVPTCGALLCERCIVWDGARPLCGKCSYQQKQKGSNA